MYVWLDIIRILNCVICGQNMTCNLELAFIFKLCKVWGVLDSRSSSLDSSPTLIVSTVQMHPGVNAG